MHITYSYFAHFFSFEKFCTFNCVYTSLNSTEMIIDFLKNVFFCTHDEITCIYWRLRHFISIDFIRILNKRNIRTFINHYKRNVVDKLLQQYDCSLADAHFIPRAIHGLKPQFGKFRIGYLSTYEDCSRSNAFCFRMFTFAISSPPFIEYDGRQMITYLTYELIHRSLYNHINIMSTPDYCIPKSDTSLSKAGQQVVIDNFYSDEKKFESNFFYQQLKVTYYQPGISILCHDFDTVNLLFKNRTIPAQECIFGYCQPHEAESIFQNHRLKIIQMNSREGKCPLRDKPDYYYRKWFCDHLYCSNTKVGVVRCGFIKFTNNLTISPSVLFTSITVCRIIEKHNSLLPSEITA